MASYPNLGPRGPPDLALNQCLLLGKNSSYPRLNRPAIWDARTHTGNVLARDIHVAELH
jgi:hypothetical protein